MLDYRIFLILSESLVLAWCLYTRISKSFLYNTKVQIITHWICKDSTCPKLCMKKNVILHSADKSNVFINAPVRTFQLKFQLT